MKPSFYRTVLGFCLVGLLAGAKVHAARRNGTTVQPVPTQRVSIPKFISPRHARVLVTWLEPLPNLRVATEKDCGAARKRNCDETIATIRTRFYFPSYQPYYAKGDFSGDGAEDFAVVLVTTGKLIGDPSYPDLSATLVIFNGPFDTERVLPSFVEETLYLSGSLLFFGHPKGWPRPEDKTELTISEWEGEGWRVVPDGTGYKCVGYLCGGTGKQAAINR